MDSRTTIDFILEKRIRAYEALVPIMASDPLLSMYQNLLSMEHVFLTNLRNVENLDKPTQQWPGGKKHLVALHIESTGRYAVLCFEVLMAEISGASVGLETLVIELNLYSHISTFNGEPTVVHVVSPNDGRPIRYRHHLGRANASCAFETVDISIADLVERFPGQVENILEKILFISEVIFDCRF